MESRYLCGTLGSRLVARGEELILFSSCDKYLGTLTTPRHQVTIIDSKDRATMFKGALQKTLWTKIQACARRREYFMLLCSLHKCFKDTINYKVRNSRT